MMPKFSRIFLWMTTAALLGGCVASSKTLMGVEENSSLNGGVGSDGGMSVLQQGLAAGRSGNTMQMLSLCRAAASAPNADPIAFQCIANAQQQMGNVNEAQAGYKAYLDRMPNDTNARVALAKTMMNNGQFQAAQSELEKAVSYNPNSADGQYLLAESYRMQNQCKPAMEHYNQAIAVNGNYLPAIDGRNRAQQDNCKGMGDLSTGSYNPSFQRPTINTRTDGSPPSLSMPGGMPGGMSGGMPGGMSGGMPGGMSGGMPGGMSGGMPGGMSGGMPGGMSGGMPGGMSGGGSYPPYPQGGGGYGMPTGSANPMPSSTTQSPYSRW